MVPVCVLAEPEVKTSLEVHRLTQPTGFLPILKEQRLNPPNARRLRRSYDYLFFKKDFFVLFCCCPVHLFTLKQSPLTAQTILRDTHMLSLHTLPTLLHWKEKKRSDMNIYTLAFHSTFYLTLMLTPSKNCNCFAHRGHSFADFCAYVTSFFQCYFWCRRVPVVLVSASPMLLLWPILWNVCTHTNTNKIVLRSDTAFYLIFSHIFSEFCISVWLYWSRLGIEWRSETFKVIFLESRSLFIAHKL